MAFHINKPVFHVNHTDPYFLYISQTLLFTNLQILTDQFLSRYSWPIFMFILFKTDPYM